MLMLTLNYKEYKRMLTLKLLKEKKNIREC